MLRNLFYLAAILRLIPGLKWLLAGFGLLGVLVLIAAYPVMAAIFGIIWLIWRVHTA